MSLTNTAPGVDPNTHTHKRTNIQFTHTHTQLCVVYLLACMLDPHNYDFQFEFFFAQQWGSGKVNERKWKKNKDEHKLLMLRK